MCVCINVLFELKESRLLLFADWAFSNFPKKKKKELDVFWLRAMLGMYTYLYVFIDRNYMYYGYRGAVLQYMSI